jgi:choline dehydrogenase
VPVTLPGFPNPAVDSVTIQASQELGGEFQFNLDMNSGTPLGLGLSIQGSDAQNLIPFIFAGWVQSTIGHDGTRSSAATGYLNDQILARENLHVVTDTFVTRVLRTPGTEGLTIRTVEVRASENSDPVLLTASKEVILSGGTIGSPLILMHSGIANAVRLREFGIPPVLDNPSVGRNLTDHPLFGIWFNLAPNSLDVGPWIK